MRQLYKQLLNDEAGFIVSAELILISTIVIISLVVGLSSVAGAINHELNDVASAFGSVNQSFQTQGQSGSGQNQGQFFIQSSAPQPESGGSN